MVVASKMPNPPLQIPFHYDVDFPVVSSYFLLYLSCPLIVREPLVGVLCGPPLLEPLLSLSRVM